MFEIWTTFDKCYEFIQYKIFMRKLINRYEKKNFSDTALICHDLLKKTSRSFALVILSLHHPLNHVCCIYYLTLRALDTIEDDFKMCKGKKVPMLKDFYLNLTDTTWTFLESNDKDKEVLEKFPNISIEYIKLDKRSQDVIRDICQKMGDGMAEFLEKPIVTLIDWDKYCYYVAGLVGIGLSHLFVTTGFEDELVAADEKLSISMGQFLQKTNILRDVHEDLLEDRKFWPLEVVSKYLKADDCQQLIQPQNIAPALHCLNELIYHSVTHLNDCLKYLSQLRDPIILAFCAIPQIMALATLTLCYNNPDVFNKNVKISRFDTVKIFNNALNMTNIRIFYRYYTRQLKSKVEANDCQCPEAKAINRRMSELLSQVLDQTSPGICPKMDSPNSTVSQTIDTDKLPVFYSTPKVKAVTYALICIILTYLTTYLIRMFTLNA